MDLRIGTLNGIAAHWRLHLSICLLAYVLLVRALRHHREKSLVAKYAPGGRESLRSMTADDAQAILKTLAELEFPKLYGLAMVVALFRTYGILSISSLLVATGQLKHKETASKRAADTGVLLLEFGLNRPASKRAIEAIARMNFLHSRYQKNGKITNDDMLYTLSIFALEPSRWIDRYEWRAMNEVEMCACGTFWKSMGDAMEIEFTKLPSSSTGWQDGLHWLREIKEWSDGYEEAHMIPANSNRELAESQFNTLLPTWPSGWQGFYKKTVIVLLGNRLRLSMILLDLRKLLLRHLALPRPEILRNHWIEAGNDSPDKHYALFDYLAHPWYVKPTLLRRWGPGAWISRLLGYKVPGDEGNKYYPQGYTFTSIGPQALSGKGINEMDKTRTRLVHEDRGRCPFSSR
ncbi:hypothetical protein ACLMJK_008939 [Lecanora helva]